MPSRRTKISLTLVGLDIEGDWNVPLLRNAADISAASMVFARTHSADAPAAAAGETVANIDEVLAQYDNIIACETGRTSRNIYEFPAPRGRTAVLVGNEVTGIPRAVLGRARQVVCVPMHGEVLSSVNVAVAAAVVLYVLERDLARRTMRYSRIRHRDADVLVRAPDNASELGSLFRSACAFGWRTAYLSDPNAVWFTKDRATITEGRAAARREVNPLVVLPETRLDFEKYASVIVCSHDRSGTPLSRFALPTEGPVLVVLGEGDDSPCGPERLVPVHVDHADATTEPRFRHRGSILLSVLSEMLHRGKHG